MMGLVNMPKFAKMGESFKNTWAFVAQCGVILYNGAQPIS